MIQVVEAEGEQGLDHARRLFRSYAAEFADSIAEALCFQGFDAEVAGLPGRHAGPSVCLLLAMEGDTAAGCVAMRDLGEGVGEMKRLYVPPEFRGRGIGRLLVEEIVRRAGQAGYRRMVLDTVPEMADAIALYRSFGFVETSPYWDCPVERTIFMERALAGWRRLSMTQVPGSSWKDAEVARRFLDERRRAIPLGDEQLQIMLRVARRFVPEPTRVIDLGCGDGFLARAVLSEFPTAHALLIDHSEPMLRRAHEAMSPFSGRYEIRHGDLSDPLPPQIGDGSLDLIVSGYAIHHLPTARKRSLYGEVFGLLAPAGLFVNVEHVASATPELEAVHDEAYIDHIAAVTGRDKAEVEREYHGRPDKADNILESVEAQVGWLREIGFDQADVYFKWLELAVFGGQRPLGI